MPHSTNLENLSHWYLEKQLEFDEKLIYYRYLTIREYFKKEACLEMGPANGIMTKYLKEDFSSLHLLDGSNVLLSEIPDADNITKFCALFEEFSPSIKYDTIIMEHILEHIDNPSQLLKRAKSWLKPDGVIIAGVPNAKSFHRLIGVKMGLLKSEYELNSRDIELGHKRVYDTDSFLEEFKKAGLKVITNGGVFIKFLSNKQIEDTFNNNQIHAFYKLSQQFPYNAADIYIVAKN